MSVDEIVEAIKVKHRARCFAMEQRKRADLAAGSFLSRALGWRKDKPQAERDRINILVSKLLSGKVEAEGDLAEFVAASRLPGPYDEIEKRSTKAMIKLAIQLPVWKSFCEPIYGFGPISLAIIVGEAGNLDNYDSDTKLWKRMGVAVINGDRQGIVPKGIIGAARKEAWIERGYSPIRRSRLFTIGGPLIQLNKGVYRAAYEHRRRHTQITHPEWWVDASGKPKLTKDGTPASAHGALDAQRYMEKRLLRDLWRAWRRTSLIMADRPVAGVSAAHSIAAE
jgi:hypothetical protein